MFSKRQKQHKFSPVNQTSTTDDEITLNKHFDFDPQNPARQRASKYQRGATITPSFSEWLLTRPLSKWPFYYFVIGCILTLANALFTFVDKDLAYLTSGILALSIALFALSHLRPLIALRHSIDTFSKNNRRLRAEHVHLRSEVDSAELAIRHLSTAQSRMKRANVQNRENLNQFRDIKHNMQTVGVKSVSQVSALQQTARKIEERWRTSLFQHERTLLMYVFERVEQKGSRRGMNCAEFQEFVSMLPSDYQQLFDRLVCHQNACFPVLRFLTAKATYFVLQGTFRALSQETSLVDYDDFKASLDIFAEMATDNVDIEFEVIASPKSARQRSIVVRKRSTRRRLRIGDTFSLFSSMDRSTSRSTSPLSRQRINEVSMCQLGLERFRSIVADLEE